MTHLPLLQRQLRWLNFPGAILFALLQRTPAVQVATTAAEFVAASPVGSVLRSAAVAAASLGAIHSMAGATQFSISNRTVTGTVGTAISAVAFTVTGAPTTPGSFRITNLPPGLTAGANGSGVLNAASGVITGTPTTAGTFTTSILAYEFSGATGDAFGPATITYTILAAAAVAPSFTAQPSSQTVSAGATVTFSSAASGSPAPTYQWSKDGVAIAGATNANLTIGQAIASDAGSYTVKATNSAGTVTSNAAVLTVTSSGGANVAPAITQAPLTQTVLAGATVALNVTATGSPAPTYQWRKDGVAIAGATKSSLILTGVTAANAGSYTVVATNSAGSATSAAGVLSLTTATNFGHLINLAIFATLTSSVPDFTVATVIGGSGTKPFLVRAVGPSLTQLGVGGVVTDTKAELFSGSTSVSINDDWGGSSTMSNAFTSVGAFPYASTTSKDSAIYLPTAASGSYSVKVSGVNGATGVVLAELYDAQPSGQFNASAPRFLDVSVLKQIGSGETLTVGFNIAGTTSRTVLIRAVGPALSDVGVTSGFMADPQLDLYSGSTILASNDDWGGDPQVNAAFTSVGAFRFSNSTSKDAVIVATLAPGGYSAVVKGLNGTSGLTLVEVYDVP